MDDQAPDALDRIVAGDVRSLAPSLPRAIADCCVTSPPYFGHRAYAAGDPRELGREATPAAYVAGVVACLRAVRPVLKPTATLWLNLGDTYRDGRLLGIPWRVALALVDDGWHLRSDVVWHKPNAMPHPSRGRPTHDHEYLFLLSAGERYHYDADAIREPHVTFTDASRMRGGRAHLGRRGGTPERGKNGGSANLHDGRWDQAFHPLGRNRRTVWSVPLGKFRGAHFAVFPEKLIEPCVLAGAPAGGVVLDPFMGAGTTAVVARRLGRRFLGCELVEAHAALARERVAAVPFPAPAGAADAS